MAKHLTYTVIYPKPIARAWADLVNPAFQEGKLRYAGTRDAKVSITPTDDGGAHVVLDRKNPVTGVYSNEMQASKMDWYIQRKSTVKRTGDNTYHVTYSFTNTLQPGEAGSLPEYITANAKGGVAVNRVVIYTPAGGEVSNVSASNGSSFAQVQAKDHMTYMDDISLAPQDTVTIEYDVTTAAGSANLKLDQTPTIGDPAITYEY